MKDFDTVRAWGMEKDPMVAVKHFKPAQTELRWKNQHHVQGHKHYHQRRTDWINNKDFDDYYKKAEKPIDRWRWEYLKIRKSWYIFPLHWDRYASKNTKRILDLGCGDGDVTQRIIEYIVSSWEKEGYEGHELEVVGLDLNPSRIMNAKEHVLALHPKINVSFDTCNVVENGIPYPDGHFDHSLTTGVIEILSDESATPYCDEMSRVTSSSIYIEDVYDEYPGGAPREDICGEFLEKHGFSLVEKHIVLQDPYTNEGSLDPMGLWPMVQVQVLFAEKTG